VEAGLTKKSLCKCNLDWWENNSRPNFNPKRRFYVTPPICCTGLGFGKMRLMLFWLTDNNNNNNRQISRKLDDF